MELMNKNRFDSLPKKDKVILFLNEVRNYLFPGYFEEIGRSCEYKHWYFGSLHEDRLITPRHTCVFKKMHSIAPEK